MSFYSPAASRADVISEQAEKSNKEPLTKNDEKPVIPATMANVEQLNLNDKSKWINNKDIAKKANVVERFFCTLFENYDFCINYSSYSRDENIKNGYFKNSIELKNKTESYIQKRLKLGMRCFGCDFYSLRPEELEKYGYLSDFKDDPSIKGYGDVKGKLNKKELWNRTTFTLGDSYATSGKTHACLVSNPTISAIPGVVNENYQVLNEIYSLIQANELNGLPPVKICNKLKANTKSHYNLDYFELQFHGPLPWSFIQAEKQEE